MKISKSFLWLLLDLFIICVVYYASFLIRFEGEINASWYFIFRATLILNILIYLLSFLVCGIYNRLWRYLSLLDVAYQLISIFYGTIVFLLISPLLLKTYAFPRSVILINACLLSLAILISRFLNRFIQEEIVRLFPKKRKKIIIIGAGDAAALLLLDIKKTASDIYQVLGFLDDDHKKIGSTINGVRVISAIDNLADIVRQKHIEEIVIAIPTATREQLDRILAITKTTGLPVKIIPSTREILDTDKVYASQLKPLDLRDLLGRNPASINSEVIASAINNKKILVTGAGGSIGYQLCYQILNFKPSALVLLERDESRLFYAQKKLKEAYSENINIFSILSDITDRKKLEAILSEFRPDVVFHAAAYKHVTLGEANPVSYVFNNIFGTVNLVESCEKYGVGKLVFISTDKAVYPANTMGVTKRICEEFIRSFSRNSKANLIIVRFGNVLGSSGSAIEIFENQIRNGRPITVTSVEIKRFFMTIEEAVILSLEAASIGANAKTFVLDMGQAIKIIDLARNMIFLSGGINPKQIPITITGLRDGDKLEEKLYEDDEDVLKTEYDKLLLLKPRKDSIDYNIFSDWLTRLKGIIENPGPAVAEDLNYMFREILPSFVPYREYLKKIEKL